MLSFSENAMSVQIRSFSVCDKLQEPSLIAGKFATGVSSSPISSATPAEAGAS